MTPTPRSPHQRDRRFARVRRLSQVLLLGSVAVSGLAVTYLAAATKPLTTIPLGVKTSSANPTTPTPSSPPSGDDGSTYSGDDGSSISGDGGSSIPTTPTTAPAPSGASTPAPAPVTTTTTCYSTPSGHVTCL